VATASGHRVRRRRTTARGIAGAASPVLTALAVLAVLELLTRTDVLPQRYLPAPTTIVSELVSQLGDGALWTALGQTLGGWLLALGIVIAIGVPVGLALGGSDLLWSAFRPVVEFLRPIPSVALVPLAVLTLGTGLQSKLLLAVYAAVWPLLIQAVYGIRDVDPVARETARVYRLRARDRFLRVTLPAVAPYLATGLRVSATTALILTVTAELIIGAPGLGQAVNVARQADNPPLVYALLVVVGLLGWGLNAVLARLERRLLRWHPGRREVAR
jgi:ABC-type nitrate/sulfonate/bicarbonate transport system permease component